MYNLLKSDVYSVFASNSWTNTGIKSYPVNYSGVIDASGPFLKISILPGKASIDTFSFKKRFNGLLILSIFVKAGNGDNDLFAVADTLDSFFQGKTLTNGTQFGVSTLKQLGLDSADKSLYRGDYSIQFNSYGE